MRPAEFIIGWLASWAVCWFVGTHSDYYHWLLLVAPIPMINTASLAVCFYWELLCLLGRMYMHWCDYVRI